MQIEKNRNGVVPNVPTESQILSSPDLKSFLYSELSVATGNFHPDNHLGEGGFGNVYKGWLHKETLTAAKPDSGMAVAVKKLKTQGLQGHKEWLVRILDNQFNLNYDASGKKSSVWFFPFLFFLFAFSYADMRG